MRARGTVLAIATALVALVVGVAAVGAASRSGPDWQNPELAANPFSNIHNDSYLSDNYRDLGPVKRGRAEVSQIDKVSFTDPATGQPKTTLLGECAAQTFDAQGNMVTLCTGVPLPSGGGTWTFHRSIVTIDGAGKILAYATFDSSAPDLEQALSDFGGAGYFYLDDQSRPVVAMPDGSIVVYQREDSVLSDVDSWVAARKIPVGGEAGPLAGHPLYALMPAPSGEIWFTTADGIVGVVRADDQVRWLDLNARGGGEERIANSHPIGRDGSAYVLTTHRIYRVKIGPGGNPRVVWGASYDRGRKQKSGQVSHGSGTSPTLFEMGGETYVAIADNARRMNVVVYRTAAKLAPGEQRLFAKVRPFGNRVAVSDENSLVWSPGPGGHGTVLFAENNWGNETVTSTVKTKTTKPGVARMLLAPNGRFTVDARNDRVAVPSVVSKASQRSGLLYTYEKRRSGWYLTALRQDDLKQAWTVRVGDGHARYNNYYAALSLDPDGKTVWIGTTLGLTKVVP
ncbi:MAG TPA: hypothetical protein VFB52_04580 [Solirubrobacterales bacterium]|nr:hypothetical protein [Solirubrobacterales bacterium]